MKESISTGENIYTENHPLYKYFLEGIEAQCAGEDQEDCEYSDPLIVEAWKSGWTVEKYNRSEQQTW